MSYGDRNWEKKARLGLSYGMGVESFMKAYQGERNMSDGIKRAMQDNDSQRYAHAGTPFAIEDIKVKLRDAMDISTGKRQIRGKFWMVQSHVVAMALQDDQFGRATFDWPGKSIFTSEEEAQKCARILAKKTGHAYFVMEAKTMVEVDKVTYKEIKL